MRKSKSFIADIDRVVIATDYYVIQEGRLKAYDKRGFSDILTDKIFKWIKAHNAMLYDTKIGKETKNISTLEYQPDKYDTYYIKIKRDMIDGQDPQVFVRRLSDPPQKPEVKKRK